VLKLVYSREEEVVRSVGAPPNGIVGFAAKDDGAVVVVSPVYQPQGSGGAQGYVGPDSAMREHFQESELDTGEAVAALQDADAARCLWACACQTVTALTAYELPLGHFDKIGAALDGAEALLDAILERFAA
jgi:hypothetical protein